MSVPTSSAARLKSSGTNSTPLRMQKLCKPPDALGLGEDAHQLAALVDRADFVRLVAALVRADLMQNYGEVRARR